MRKTRTFLAFAHYNGMAATHWVDSVLFRASLLDLHALHHVGFRLANERIAVINQIAASCWSEVPLYVEALVFFVTNYREF